MKTGHYLVLEPDRSVRWEYIRHETWMQQLHQIINCDFVEQVRTLEPGLLLIDDESGKIKDPPKERNPLASNFYLGWLRMRRSPWDIVGTVVFAQEVPSGNCYGEMTWGPLDDGMLAFVADMLGFDLPSVPKA